MVNDNINIGIVGLGFMAAMHIRAYSQIDGANVARGRRRSMPERRSGPSYSQ